MITTTKITTTITTTKMITTTTRMTTTITSTTKTRLSHLVIALLPGLQTHKHDDLEALVWRLMGHHHHLAMVQLSRAIHLIGGLHTV